MKTRQALMAALFAVFLVLAAATGSAWAWGNITHFSIANDLLQSEEAPEVINTDVFIRAAVGPDLAWTPVFVLTGRDYVHDTGFAAALEKVAGQTKRLGWRPEWRDMARAWKAHLAADEVAHTQYVPEPFVYHAMVEDAVDAAIFHGCRELGSEPLIWQDYTINLDSCDPNLIYLASRIYRPKKPVYRWMVREGVEWLAQEIDRKMAKAEETDCGKSGATLWVLEILGEIPDADWTPYYAASLNAAQGTY